jgi:hypothetical protein
LPAKYKKLVIKIVYIYAGAHFFKDQWNEKNVKKYPCAHGDVFMMNESNGRKNAQVRT